MVLGGGGEEGEKLYGVIIPTEIFHIAGITVNLENFAVKIFS